MSKSWTEPCPAGPLRKVIACPSYCCYNATHNFCCDDCKLSVDEKLCNSENYFGIVAGCLFSLLVISVVILAILSCCSKCASLRRRFPWLNNSMQTISSSQSTSGQIPQSMPPPIPPPSSSDMKPPSYSDCTKMNPPTIDEPYQISPCREPPPRLEGTFMAPSSSENRGELPLFPPDYEEESHSNTTVFTISDPTVAVSSDANSPTANGLANPGYAHEA